ncbi:MAG: OmpA family protein [Pseudomonadota bacterium]
MQTSRVRWFWGLPAIAIIWLMAWQFEQPRMAEDLKVRAESALRQAGVDWAFVVMSGRNAQLVGEAVAKQEQHLAERIVGKVYGIAAVQNSSQLAAIEENYIWSAAVKGGSLQLTGYFPNKDIRKSVVSAAKQVFPRLPVSDQMRPARGAPQDGIWLGAIQFGLAQLSRLENGGKVYLDGTKFAIAGVANSVGAYRTIKGQLYRNVPSGVILVNDKVKPPVVFPFEWQAVFENGQLLLQGYVPSERDRDALIKITKAVFAKSPIVDKMAVAGGAPDQWLNTAGVIIQELAKLNKGSASLSNTKIAIKGEAQKQAVADAVRTALQTRITTLYQLTQDLKYIEATIPTIRPFTTSAVSQGKHLLLSGYTLGESQTNKIVAAIRKARPDATVDNRLALGKGAPDGWLSCVLAGLEGLLKLDNGRAEVSDRELSVSGLTRDEAVNDALPKLVRAAANRACKEKLDITLKLPPEPNLDWRAAYDGTQLTLQGEVPNSGVVEALNAQAAKLFPKAKVTSDLRIKPSQSKKWGRVANVALEQLAKLRLGTAHIKAQVLTLDGEAPDTAVATAVKEQLKATVAKGYKAESKIIVKSAAMLWAEQKAKRKAEEAAAAAAKVEDERKRKEEEAERAAKLELERMTKERERQRLEDERRAREAALERERKAKEAEARRKAQEAARLAEIEKQKRELKLARDKCQQALNATTTEGTISFGPGSDKLQSKSFPTLDKVAGLSTLCGTINIEIGGHTDSRGSAESNQRLSERRAEAVRSYLEGKGLAAAQLKAVGFGETKPLVPNTTARNRARNRRIEFRVEVN